MSNTFTIPSNRVNLLMAHAVGLIMATVLQAQVPVTGKWRGTTRNGMEVLLTLKAADGALTGTLTRDGQSSTITEGKVSGNTFSFKVILGEQIEAISGELDGAQLKAWLDRQGRDGTIVFDQLKE